MGEAVGRRKYKKIKKNRIFYDRSKQKIVFFLTYETMFLKISAQNIEAMHLAEWHAFGLAVSHL